MRWLRGIALLLLVWSLMATVVFQYCLPVLPQSATIDEIHARKVERAMELISTAQTVAIACWGLALLIGLGKRMLSSKWMAPSSSANPPLAAGHPAPPRSASEGLSDDPPHF